MWDIGETLVRAKLYNLLDVDQGGGQGMILPLLLSFFFQDYVFTKFLFIYFSLKAAIIKSYD